MLNYFASIAFLAVLVIPIGIFFLTLIQLTVEEARGTTRPKTVRVKNYQNEEVPTPRLRVVK